MAVADRGEVSTSVVVGVTGSDPGEASEDPTSLVATTLTTYSSPFVTPLIVHDNAALEHEGSATNTLYFREGPTGRAGATFWAVAT